MTDPKPRIPVTDAQFLLVQQYRSSTKRLEDALHWMKSDMERLERDRKDRSRRPYGSSAQSIAQQAVTMAQAQEALENIVQMAEVLFPEAMDDFYGLVDWDIMPDFQKEN